MLPILCIIYLKNINAFTHYGSIDLYVWNGKDFKEEATKFLNSKTFIVVNLTGNLESDISKLEVAQKNIQKIISTKDSIKGIKFHFEEKAQYWSYTKVLEILQIEKAENYLPYKNDIWFANPKVVKQKPNVNKAIINYFICTSGRVQDEYVEEIKNIISYQKIMDFSKIYYLPIIAYVLMLFFTFRRIMKDKRSIR